MAYRWGVIGPGRIAQTFADALRQLSEGTLHAVASRDVSRASAFAEKNGAQVVCNSYEALLTDPNVDIVYIATPHSHHYPVAKQALEAKKSLLVEKPLTVNTSQTQRLVELSEYHNCVFQEALWSRFMPCFATVKRWIDEGKIGQVQYITSQIGFAFKGEASHRLLNPSLAGGSLLDLGIYSVSLSQYLLGESPVHITANTTPKARNVDHNTFVTMHYESGVVSQFVSTIDAQCSNVMTIHGSEGYIHLPSRFWTGNQCSLWVDDVCVDSQAFTHHANGFEYQIAATMSLMDSNERCDARMSHADSIGVMETMDKIREIIGLRYSDNIEAL